MLTTIRNPGILRINPSGLGGQHAAPVGDSTMHHKCQWDFSVALEQAGRMFDIDGAGDCEPAYIAFEAEREAAEGERDVAF